MDKKYGALRIISTLYKLIAILIFLGGLAGAVLFLLGGSVSVGGGSVANGNIIGAIGSAIGGFISAVSIYAFANLIDLLVATEENTRATAMLIKELIKRQ